MNKNRSIAQQKAYGTYERNQEIIRLYESGLITNMSELGRHYGISRQAVRMIIRQSALESETAFVARVLK